MSRCEALVDVGRRAFFARTAMASVAAAATATLPTQSKAGQSRALATYPASRLANIQDLKVNMPVQISYPDGDSPGVLLKLGTQVDGGVGPEHDIVAFSTLCPHRGYPLNYSAADRTLACPGHYSRFDVEKGGLEIWGHATQNLPQFRLVVDRNGDIHAVAVDELIYGRLNNVLKS